MGYTMIDDYKETAEKLKKILENNLQLIFDIDCFETNMKNEAIKGSDRMALLRALQFNIGDILCKTDKDSVEDVKKARQEIANILQDNNIQSGRIKFIINVFSYALDWTDEEKERQKAEAQQRKIKQQALEEEEQRRREEEAAEKARREAEVAREAKAAEEKAWRESEAAHQVEIAQKAAQQEREAREKAQQETAMARNEKAQLERQLANEAKKHNNKAIAIMMMLCLMLGAGYFFISNREDGSYKNNANQQVKKSTVFEHDDDYKNYMPNESRTSSQESKKSENTEQVKTRNNAEDSADILKRYHSNITDGNYRGAYACTSDAWQSRVGYEGWAKGFATTVSSEVSNITVESSSDNQVILDYTLKAVDNPGGTKYFNGRAVMIKTSSGWKIDDMKNKVK